MRGRGRRGEEPRGGNGNVIVLAAHQARASSGRAASAASASSVTTFRPSSSRDRADQYSGGIAFRERQLLTVDFASDSSEATREVPPRESMMSSTVMATDLVRVTRTSQGFANRETTFLQPRGHVVGMVIDPPHLIARRLRAIRLATGFKHRNAFAEEIGLTKNTYSPWEQGNNPKRTLTFESALVIRAKWGIPLDWQFYGALEDAIEPDLRKKIREHMLGRKAA